MCLRKLGSCFILFLSMKQFYVFVYKHWLFKTVFINIPLKSDYTGVSNENFPSSVHLYTLFATHLPKSFDCLTTLNKSVTENVSEKSVSDINGILSW